MKIKTIRRIVSLAIFTSMLITALPLMQIQSGLADDTKPISARINGLEQEDGKNLADVSKKSGINTAISSIEVVSGVITQDDFETLKDKNQHKELREITMKTMQSQFKKGV